MRTIVFNGRPFQTRYLDVFSSVVILWDDDSTAVLVELRIGSELEEKHSLAQLMLC